LRVVNLRAPHNRFFDYRTAIYDALAALVGIPHVPPHLGEVAGREASLVGPDLVLFQISGIGAYDALRPIDLHHTNGYVSVAVRSRHVDVDHHDLSGFRVHEKFAHVAQHATRQRLDLPRPDARFAAQAPGITPFKEAKARVLLHTQLPCLGCHELDGEGGRVAPSFTNIAARRNAAYIGAIIDDPQRVVPGAAMPNTPMPASVRE